MSNQQKEDLQTFILRCDENIQRIEDRLDTIDKKHEYDGDLQSYLVRSQLEFILLNTLDNKSSKEQQLRSLEEQEKWMKEHPTPAFVTPYPGAPIMSMPSTVGTINQDDVESTVMFQHKVNKSLGNVVLKMKAGIYLDPASRSIWTPTEDWEEKKSIPGMVL